MLSLSLTGQMDLHQDDIILLKQNDDLTSPWPASLISQPPLPDIPVGYFLGTEEWSPLFQSVMRTWLPDHFNPTTKAYWLRVLASTKGDSKPQSFHYWPNGRSLACITLSDKGAQGKRSDESGPIIPQLVKDVLPVSIYRSFLIPDEPVELKGIIANLAFEQKFDLICTTGGTGVTSRDITPEVTLSLIDKRLPGFEQTMTATSLKKTPHGMISRAIVGIISRTLIINLPGSPKAVQENLASILPALKHTLDKIHDDPGECAPIFS